jgi:hypothetical protein
MRRLAAAMCGLLVLSAAAGAVAVAPWCAAANEAAPAAAPPSTPAAAKALNVLATYCAGCHQADRSAGGAPQGDLDGILDLAALAREPSLVRPGQPDASALYTRLLMRHPASAAEHPGAHEAEAVRTWIDELPQAPGDCGDRPRFSGDQMNRAIAAWLAQVGPEGARDTRFVTLGPLTNACATEAELATSRAAVAALLARLSRDGAAPHLDTIEDTLSILTFRLQELGWDAARWDVVAAGHPRGSAPELAAEVARATGSALPVLRADWLAHAFGRSAQGEIASAQAGAPGDRQRGEAGAAAFEVGEKITGLAALARFYERAVDLPRAAAELLRDPADLAARLEAVTGELQPLAMRLRLGLLPRPERERLYAALRVSSAPQHVEEEDPSLRRAGLELALWSEKARYKPDEIATFHAEASADCHLTLINIDPRGKATVLFPNELEPDNLVRARKSVRVPGAEAGYRLRFTQTGNEIVIGICSASPQPPHGIVHDFALQRFTILGDWRAFLREATSARRTAKSERVPVRRRVAAPATTSAVPGGSEPQAQTAITVRVE